jgi:hypothetical protein
VSYEDKLLKKALEGAVGIVGDPQRGYRAGLFFDGMPLAAVGPARGKYQEAEDDAQSFEKALAIVVQHVVQDVHARPKCDCTEKDATSCASAHFKSRGVHPNVAAALARGAPCPCPLCHWRGGGAA